MQLAHKVVSPCAGIYHPFLQSQETHHFRLPRHYVPLFLGREYADALFRAVVHWMLSGIHCLPYHSLLHLADVISAALVVLHRRAPFIRSLSSCWRLFTCSRLYTAKQIRPAANHSSTSNATAPIDAPPSDTQPIRNRLPSQIYEKRFFTTSHPRGLAPHVSPDIGAALYLP